MEKEGNVHAGHRQRLKRQFLEAGLDSLSDVNCLELLLFYAIARRDTNPLAHALLEQFGSLSAVFNAAPEQLQQVPGISEHAAVLLHAIPALGRRYFIDQTRQEKILNSTERCGAYLIPYFFGAREEQVYLLSLDAKCKVLCCKEVTEGSVNSASISVRRVVETALGANASTVVLAHNHPSGLAIPSAEDVQTTRRIAKALSLVEITLADHIVVAEDDFVSLAQSGLFHPGVDFED